VRQKVQDLIHGLSLRLRPRERPPGAQGETPDSQNRSSSPGAFTNQTSALQPARAARQDAQERLQATWTTEDWQRRDVRTLAVQALLAATHVFDLSRRKLTAAAAAVALHFGLSAFHRVRDMLADVLSDHRVRSPGAVAAHRIRQLMAGDLSHWPVPCAL